MINPIKNEYQFGKMDGKPLSWNILTHQDRRILLLCTHIVSRGPYNLNRMGVTWEQSSVRNWLNSSFKNTFFSFEELDQMCVTKIENENNPYNGTLGGITTQDTFFLLSISEVNEYLPHYYNRSIGPEWWLRTPGDREEKAMFIGSDGQRQYFGYYVNTEIGIRPAVWVQL